MSNELILNKLLEMATNDPVSINGMGVDEFALKESKIKQTNIPSPVDVTPDGKLVFTAPEFKDEEIFEEAAKILESLKEGDEMGLFEELENTMLESMLDETTEESITPDEIEDLEEAFKLGEDEVDLFSEDLDLSDLESLEEDVDMAGIDSILEDIDLMLEDEELDDSLEGEEGEEVADVEGGEEEENEEDVEVMKLDDGTVVVVINGVKYVCKPQEETGEEEQGEEVAEESVFESIIDSEEFDKFITESLGIVEESDFEDELEKLIESLDL